MRAQATLRFMRLELTQATTQSPQQMQPMHSDLKLAQTGTAAKG